MCRLFSLWTHKIPEQAILLASGVIKSCSCSLGMVNRISKIIKAFILFQASSASFVQEKIPVFRIWFKGYFNSDNQGINFCQYVKAYNLLCNVYKLSGFSQSSMD